MSEKNLKIFINDLSYVISLPFRFRNKITYNKDNEIKDLIEDIKLKDNEIKKLIIYNHDKDERISILERDGKFKEILFQEMNSKFQEYKNLTKIKILKLENDIKSNDNLCSICYENKINICCIPCGHTYCDRCISNAVNCYSCRSHIIRTNKIYI